MSSGPAGVVPAPPTQLKCNMWQLPQGTVLHRIHDKSFGATDFNPGKGDSRFAPFQVNGANVPTAYAATSLECAIYEAIYHDIEPGAAFKSVYWSGLAKLDYSTLEVTCDLTLAKLFSADLMKWKMERTQLIDTPRSTYHRTRLWAPAIHQSDTRLAGMVWTSRKYDEERAMMLFGDRLATGGIVSVRSVGVVTDPATLQLVYELGHRSDIDIIR